MSFTSVSQWGPSTTPPTIKYLITATCILSLLSAATQTIFDQFGLAPGPQHLFSLSWWGIDHFYLWQFASFLFIQPYSPAGITFFSLLSLSFTAYMIWVLGTSVYELVGKTAFLRFYFFCGIGAGIIALMLFALAGRDTLLAGQTAVILALLTAWSMAYPESEILLFFLIPVKAKWILTGLAGSILLIALSQWDLTALSLYIPSILLGYGYACLAWGWRSPFPATQKIDALLARIGLKLRSYIRIPQWLKSKKSVSETHSSSTQQKIVDISTGAPLSDDDAFVDEMLSKISKHGENALSWSEKRRMQHISERKRKEQEEKNRY